MSSRYVALAGPRRHLVEVRAVEDHYEVAIDGVVHRVDSSLIDGSHVRSLLIGGRSYEAATVQEGDRYDVYLSGEIYPVLVYDEVWARAREGRHVPREAGEEISAPIPGAVVRILVQPGDVVLPGAPVLVLEAMKMQNELTARHGGKVAEIRTAVGKTVAQGDVLVVIREAHD